MAATREWRRWLKLTAFALVPSAVLLVAAETCATLAIERSARTEVDATGQSQYSLRIGRFPWSRMSVTPLNSMGLPDIEFTGLPAKQGCRHIVFAGDSFVFGDGVDSDSSFVGMIRSWSRTRPGCVRVFNLGERGTTIDRQADRVRETLDLLQPDIVILGQYQNDLTDFDNPPRVAGAPGAGVQRAPTDVRKRFGSLNLNLVRFVSYHAFGAAIRNDVSYDVLRHWSVLADTTRRQSAERLMARYATEFDSLRADLAARDIDFGVLIIPSKFDVLAGRYPEEEYFVGLARRAGVPYLQLFPVLDERRSPYPFLMYDGHFNETGNRVVADAVLQWLFETEPPPFPRLEPDSGTP